MIFNKKEITELKNENSRLKGQLSRLLEKNEYETVHHIPIDRICLDSIRGDEFCESKGFVRLTASISKYGQLVPILVKRLSIDQSDETGLFTLVSGMRRINAMKTLGEKKIKAIIIPSSNKDISKLSFIDNSLREPYSVFENAEKIDAIYKFSGEDAETVANDLCMTKNEVENYLMIHKLNEIDREMCKEYSLLPYQIKCVAKISDDSQRKIAIRHIGSAGLSKRQTEEYLFDLLGIEALADLIEPAKRKMVIKDIRLLYNTIDRAVDSFEECGIKVECIKRETVEGFSISLFIKKAQKEQVV